MPLVEAFVARLSTILSWDRMAAEEAIRIRKELAVKGTPIGGNDTMIAGHALAAGCVLITTTRTNSSVWEISASKTGRGQSEKPRAMTMETVDGHPLPPEVDAAIVYLDQALTRHLAEIKTALGLPAAPE